MNVNDLLERQERLRESGELPGAKGSGTKVERKTRMSFSEMAGKRSRCQEAKARGEECTEFANTSKPVQKPNLSSPSSFRWVSVADLAMATTRLASKIPHTAAGVVGIARSGLMPAAQVATLLHLPLFELTEDGIFQLGYGVRGRGQSMGFRHRPGGPVVVVDDTVYSGGEMLWARGVCDKHKLHAVYAASYVRPEARHHVDIYGDLLPCPHLLEWNLANCGVSIGNAANPIFGAGVGFDLDGVICHDEASGCPGGPYLIPRSLPIPLICTGRHEASRENTEAWLRRWGVQWQRLEMLPTNVPLTMESAAAHKAKHYGDSRLGFFVESDPEQAERIHELTRKPVICPKASKVYAQL